MGQDDQQFERVGKHCFTILFGIGIALLTGSAAHADQSMPCPGTEQVDNAGTVTEKRLSEISGLVASRKQPGILWVHNDSGDRAIIYAINLQGRLVAEIQLIDDDGNNVVALDCEDIALAPGTDNDDVLYLADIGDNPRSRETVRIYQLAEPQIIDMPDDHVVRKTAVCDVIKVSYPDGPRDAETLLVDPISGDIVIVSKDFIHARVYRIPSGPDDVITLEFLTQMSWGFMTGGDISSDGSSILLRGYWNAQMWPRSSEGDWWTLLAVSGCPVALAVESQGEAIGFSADGLGYFTISEGTQPSLYSYRILSESIAD